MAYPHISPGDKFRPNAEKENALSRLLDKAQGPAFIQSAFPPEERSVSLAFNAGSTIIQPGAPVAILKSADAPPLTIGTPAILVSSIIDKKPREWGIALEEIRPGGIGPVQISGISMATKVQGTPSACVDVTFDGRFFYNGDGIAQVLRYDQEEQTALVNLDPSLQYRGYYAVEYDGKTISVFDGGAPDSGIAGYFYMNGELRDAKSAHGITPKTGFLCLKNGWSELHGSFEILERIPSKPSLYGKPDYHPIAIIKQAGTSFSVRQISKWEIPQLWTFAECETEEDNGEE